MKVGTKQFPESTRLPCANSSGSTYAAGKLVRVGRIYGIVVADIADGKTGLIETRGRVTLTKATGWTAVAGQPVGGDTTNNRAQADTTTGVLGAAVGTVLTGDTTIEIELGPVANEPFQIVRSPTAGEDTANVVTIDTGFGANPAGYWAVSVVDSTGAPVAITTTTWSAGVATITYAAVSTQKVSLIAYRWGV